MCKCLNNCNKEQNNWGKHHSISCEKYATETFPYLFYYNEKINAYVQVPNEIEELLNAEIDLKKGERKEIKFQRVDLTDEQFSELAN